MLILWDYLIQSISPIRYKVVKLTQDRTNSFALDLIIAVFI